MVRLLMKDLCCGWQSIVLLNFCVCGQTRLAITCQGPSGSKRQTRADHERNAKITCISACFRGPRKLCCPVLMHRSLLTCDMARKKQKQPLARATTSDADLQGPLLLIVALLAAACNFETLQWMLQHKSEWSAATA